MLLKKDKNFISYWLLYILLLSLKKINIICWVCYNLKVTNICTFHFNYNQNFIKRGGIKLHQIVTLNITLIIIH